MPLFRSARIPDKREISAAINRLGSLLDNEDDVTTANVLYTAQVALRWVSEPNDWDIVDEAMASAKLIRETPWKGE